MGRQPLQVRFVESQSARLVAVRPGCFRAVLEPLEARTMLSASTLRSASPEVAPASQSGSAIDYTQPGPFQVGSEQVTVARTAGDSGTFSAELFYPATSSGSNTPFDGSGGMYPVVSFAHGYDTDVLSEYTLSMTQLASYGYLVIAPLSYESVLDVLNTEHLGHDMTSAYNYMLSQNRTASSPFFDHVATSGYAAMGHSMGGAASISEASENSAVKTVVTWAAQNMSTPNAYTQMPNVHVPMQMIAGTQDGVVAASTTATIYADGKSPIALNDLVGGFHFGFEDYGNSPFSDSGSMPRATELGYARAFSVEWLNLYMKGDQSAWQQLWGPPAGADPQVQNSLKSGIAVTTTSNELSGAGGSILDYTIEVQNTGTYATSYSLFADNNLWNTSFSTLHTPVLAVGGTATFQVLVTVPAGSPAGATDNVLISARNDTDGGTRGYVQLQSVALSSPPVFTGGSTSTWTNAGPVTVATGNTITASANMASMTVSLSSPYLGDALNATAIGNITIAGNGTGTLVLTGADTAADYQAVLQAITYNNTNGGPGVASETRSVTGVDALGGVGNTVNDTIDINLAPAVLLNPPSAGNGSAWSGTAVSVVAPTTTITDGESGKLASLTASLGGVYAGDVLSDNTAGTSISSTFNASTGVLTLSGIDTLAHYQQVLASVTYNNTTGGPAIGAEIVSVVANDGTNSSAAVTGTININVAPVVLLNSPAANNNTTFTNTGAVAIGNPGHVSLTDGETASLVSLTASITSPNVGDILTDSVAGTSITSSYNAATGILALSGSDTLVHYQQVLGTVKYNNNTGSPGVASETVSVVANDGTNSSAAALATININPREVSTVSAVKLFYDNSKFNKNVEGVGTGTIDDKAIDTTKTVHLPGAGTANFSNISAYTDGINGIMVDLTQGAGTHTNINASDFTFRVGLNNAPSKWATAPAPSTISVRTSSPVAGNDRVELTWTDGSITQEFLEVTMLADGNTGLGIPYTFFYGSVIANSGTGDTVNLAITSSTDENAARNHNAVATVTNVFDYNKDGFVNSSDENAARNNGATIKFIKIAANTPLAPDAAPAVAPDVSVAPATTVAPASAGDTGIASGLTALLNSLKTGTLPPLRLDWLSSELTNVNLNSGATATIFEALATADTKLARSILVEADKVADELGLDGDLLDTLLVDLRLE